MTAQKEAIGVVGLGRMGGGIAQRLAAQGFTVFGYDMHAPTTPLKGVTVVSSFESLLASASRTMLLVPAGEAVDAALASLLFAHTQKPVKNMLIVDGGNSRYTDSIERGKALHDHGIGFVDAGISGGVHGLANGYCIMAGGATDDIARMKDVFDALAAPGGFAHVGKSGAGHYVKMVHNGIEYGLLQAYAEGVHLLKEGAFADLDIAQISAMWEHGSVVRSWLLELLTTVLRDKEKVKNTAGVIHENGTGRWTLQEAKKHGVPVAVIEASLQARSWSRETGGNEATKIVALLREAFGGHAIEKRQDSDE